MTQELLPYYKDELAFIRKMGEEFAAAHPKIAGRLKLPSESAQDPHVDRLIEAFAFLNARIRYKLDDDFPQLAEALLGVISPHYLAPIPSAAIVQFQLDQQQGELTKGYPIERGTALDTDSIEGRPCKFRTCYPLTLWPIKLASAAIKNLPFTAPEPHPDGSKACLSLELQCLSPKMQFQNLEMDRLRFFLKGQTQYVYQLHELLLNNTIGVAIAASPNDPNPVRLDAECIRPVGFDPEESLLPDSRSFWGYRLLSEYFAFREKFLFFDIADIPHHKLPADGRAFVYLYFNQESIELERHVADDTFQLGCTPAVNLFKHTAEAKRLSNTDHEIRVVPDARRPRAFEVYSIDDVAVTHKSDNQRVEYKPFYSVKHVSDAEQQRAFWHAVRRFTGYAGGQVDHGTEMYLTLVDLDFNPQIPDGATLHVETTCTNRDLPHSLPMNPALHLASGGPAKVKCITHPSRVMRPALQHGVLWRLISQLSLNHLSLVDTGAGAEPLREFLSLYDFTGAAENRMAIEGLAKVDCQRATRRLGRNICRGLEVTLTFDEEKFSDGGVYLMAAVLERFLRSYTSINSFTQTVVRTVQRHEEVLCRWKPQVGDTALT